MIFKVDDCLTLSATPTKLLPEVSNPTKTVAIPIKLSLTLAMKSFSPLCKIDVVLPT